MTLLDRRLRQVVTHRLACGRPGLRDDNGRPGAPTMLDHLEITFSEQQKNGAFIADTEAMRRLPLLDQRYTAEKPRRLPIRVDDDDIDVFLSQEYQARVTLPVLDRATKEPVIGPDGKPRRVPRVWCRGNGAQAKRLDASQMEVDIPCNANPFTFSARTEDELLPILRTGKYDVGDGKRCPFAQNGDGKRGPTCKPTTLLLCRCDVVSNVGAWCRVVSHGHATADRIRQTLLDIKAKMPGGMLRDVPLDLVLTMRPSSNPVTRGRLLPALHIELRLQYEDTIRLLDANLQQGMRVLGAVKEQRRLLAAAKEELEDGDDAEAPEMVVEGQEGGGRL